MDARGGEFRTGGGSESGVGLRGCSCSRDIVVKSDREGYQKDVV